MSTQFVLFDDIFAKRHQPVATFTMCWLFELMKRPLTTLLLLLDFAIREAARPHDHHYESHDIQCREHQRRYEEEDVDHVELVPGHVLSVRAQVFAAELHHVFDPVGGRVPRQHRSVLDDGGGLRHGGGI